MAIETSIPAGNQAAALPPPTEDERVLRARLSVQPNISAGMTVNAYKGDAAWEKIDGSTLMAVVKAKIEQSKGGDLGGLEAMLVGQAIALDAIFSALAARAASQTQIQCHETYLGLAMRAQAGSRATIQAVIDLKFPRQTTFIKQANVTKNGPQQINNTGPTSRAKEIKAVPANKVLRGAKRELLMDTRAESQAITGRPRMAAVDKVYRAKVPRG